MTPEVHAGFESWSLPVPVTCALVLTAFVYARGWWRVRRASLNVTSIGRLAAFLTGLFLVWIAVGSPLAGWDDDLLTIHMVQHILLMTIAPPLILLGAPALPFLRGLPQRFVRATLGPVLRWPPLQQLGSLVTHPVFGWFAASLILLGWHYPAAFELGLRSEAWHEVEHASFFLSGLLFWWPVVQPWPSVAQWPRWRIPLYLFFATLPCDALSAFLAFCDRVVYPSYLAAPRPFSILPLQDQQCAGALMWTCATFIYLVPAVVITVHLLSPSDTSSFAATPAGFSSIATETLPARVEVA